MRRNEAMRVIKTWVNAWATSARYHEAVKLPWLFGCPGGQDIMTHHVLHPHLYAVQLHLADASDNPLIRIGLCNPSVDSLNNVAFTFAGYHAVRRSARIQLLQSSLLAAQNGSHHPDYPEPGNPLWAAN